MQSFKTNFFVVCLIVIASMDVCATSDISQIDKDIKTTEQFLKQNPNHAEANKQMAILYNNKANYYYNKKQFDKAIDYGNQALGYSTTAPQIKLNLSTFYLAKASALYKTGSSNSFQSYRHKDAKTLLKQSLAANPKNVQAYLLLGEIEYFNQKLDAARTAWQQALKYEPNNTTAKQKLAKLKSESKVESRMLTRNDRYFTIKYEVGVNTPANFDLRTELNRARVKVSRDFRYRLNHKIIVIGYDDDTYRNSVQHAPEWSGALYDGKIRLPLPEKRSQVEFAISSIVHEFTHAIIHDVAKGHCPHWLNEGIAVYIEDKYGLKRNINNYKKALKYKKLASLNTANDLFKSSDLFEVRLGYEQSFMFVKYLVKRYGFSRVNKVLAGLADTTDLNKVVDSVFLVDLATLERRWHSSISYF